jgi:High potential iron-sulfur protein
MSNRRKFMAITAIGLVSAAGLTRVGQAQTARLVESEAAATALGYRHDASKVDKAKFPRFAAGQLCSNCALYQGKPTDPWAPCAVVGGKLVAAKGWCNVWAKKPA